MSRLAHMLTGEPHRLVDLLWPLALLTPFIPGLPRPTHGGFNWRQELTLALLLSLAFALSGRRAARAGGVAPALPGRDAMPPAVLPLAAFVAWGAASVLWATDVFAAVHYALSWVCYLLFFLLVVRAASSPRALRAGVTLLGVVVLIIAAANVVGHWGAANSLLRHNGLGEPVAVAVPLFASLALCVRRRRAAMFCGLTAVVGWLSMLQIAERASFVAVMAGLLLLAAAMAATPRFRPRSAVRPVLLGVAFAACLALQFAPTPFERSAHSPVVARLAATSAEDPNARARFLYWWAAFEMWRTRPLTGVGAGGFSTKMPEARAAFAARRPDSTLTGINEKFLCAGAHNEYLQIFAELGAVGLALFVCFCGAIVWGAWRALRHSRGPLVPGAVASLAVFALSSGASAVSFRWMGSGLVFFFAAALVARRALDAKSLKVAPSASGPDVTAFSVAGRLGFSAAPRLARACGLALSLLAACVMATHAAHVQIIAAAQGSADEARAEGLYRAALAVNPLNAAAHYHLGLWLYDRKREREALPHLRFAVARGFNTSTCYGQLAGAESGAGEPEAAERTLAEAARVFPRSTFARVRHAAQLRRLGRDEEAGMEMAAALLLDSRAARGWQRLIEDDIDAAIESARRDPAGYAVPGELQPDDAVFAVLRENERRFPEAAAKGWRARMRSN